MSHAGRAAAPRHLHRKKPHQAGNRTSPRPRSPCSSPTAAGPTAVLAGTHRHPEAGRGSKPWSITPVPRLAVRPRVWPFNLRLGRSTLDLPRDKVELPSITPPRSLPWPALNICFAPCFKLEEEGRKPRIFAPRGAPVAHPSHRGKALPRVQQGYHQHLHPAHRPSCQCRTWVLLDPSAWVVGAGNLLCVLWGPGCTPGSWSLFINRRGQEVSPADAPCTHMSIFPQQVPGCEDARAGRGQCGMDECDPAARTCMGWPGTSGTWRRRALGWGRG